MQDFMVWRYNSMTIMNKKNHVEIGKIQLFKKQTNKSCKPNQKKPHHTCCCGDAIAALQLFVYKTKTNQKVCLQISC